MIKKRLFSKQIKVNLTEEAHHRINALARDARLTVSEFVRRLLDKKTIGAPLPYKDKTKIIYRKVDPELLYEINKIGINLNQIAKRLNKENILSQLHHPPPPNPLHASITTLKPIYLHHIC